MFDQMIDGAMNFQVMLAAYDGAGQAAKYVEGLWAVISLMLSNPSPIPAQ